MDKWCDMNRIPQKTGKEDDITRENSVRKKRYHPLSDVINNGNIEIIRTTRHDPSRRIDDRMHQWTATIAVTLKCWKQTITMSNRILPSTGLTRGTEMRR